MLLNYRQQIKTPSSVFTAFEMDREGLRGFTPSFSFFFFSNKNFACKIRKKVLFILILGVLPLFPTLLETAVEAHLKLKEFGEAWTFYILLSES